jgi:hypothetical protein
MHKRIRSKSRSSKELLMRRWANPPAPTTDTLYEIYSVEANLQTNNNTPTNIGPLIPIPAGRNASIKVWTTGRVVSGGTAVQDFAHAEAAWGAKNVGGVVSVGGPVAIFSQSDADFAGTAVNIVASGANAQVQITGVLSVPATVIAWQISIEVQLI